MSNKVLLNAKTRDGTECEIEVPVTCNIRLFRNGGVLKGVAKLDYAGITINDIRIIERRGALSIVYPTRTIVNKRNGEERETSIVFPNVRDLATKFNHIIQSEYSQSVLKANDSEVLKVIRPDEAANEAA